MSEVRQPHNRAFKDDFTRSHVDPPGVKEAHVVNMYKFPTHYFLYIYLAFLIYFCVTKVIKFFSVLLGTKEAVFIFCLSYVCCVYVEPQSE